MPRPLRVFLCHASQDKSTVIKIYSYLKQHGIQPWLDQKDLLPGQKWETEIPNAINNSDVILVCLSKNSINKEGYVQREITFALDKALEKPEGTIFVIPVKLEECQVPKQLRQYQWVDYFNDDERALLLKSLTSRAQSLGVTTPLIINRKGKLPLAKFALAFLAIILVILGGINLIDFYRTSPTIINTFDVNSLNTGSKIISEKDGMILVYVPAGPFIMGSDEGSEDEMPIHQVNLDSFWIDQTEVTNAMYAKCVADGACSLPTSAASNSRTEYFGNPEYDNYPVINVNWEKANVYCSWAGRKLPTEAQWEKAARGTDGKRIYPWSNSVECTYANYWGAKDGCIGDTTEVGSYENGKSPYGVYDMAGNVSEWVSDWYDETYYLDSPSHNPLGPYSGQYLVLRGGAWSSVENRIRSTDRQREIPTYTAFNIGFRCALLP